MRLRVTMQRIRGGNLTRTYRVRIPGGIKPRRADARLHGFQQHVADDGAARAILLGEEPATAAERTPGPADDLIEAIGVARPLGRRAHAASAATAKRAFRDDDLVHHGPRAHDRVRVVRR